LSSQLRSVLGGAVRFDSAVSPLLFSRSDKLRRKSGRLFGHLEWQALDGLTINLGGNAELVSDADNFGSARLGFNYQIDNGASWRFTANHGERIGTLLEANQEVILRYSDELILDGAITSPESLEPEKLSAYEVGYSNSWWAQQVQLDARAFYEDYTGLIGSRRESFPFELDDRQSIGVRRNNTNLLLKGYELELGLRLGRRWLAALTVTDFELSGYVHKHLFPEEYFQPQYNRAPSLSRSGLISYQTTNGWLFSASAAYQSAMKWTDGNQVESHIRADLKAAKSWQLNGGGALKLALTAQNIGQDYAEFYLTNQFQTRYVLSLELLRP